jgi:hypothetical protein
MVLVHALYLIQSEAPLSKRLTLSMSRGGISLEYGALSSEPTPFPLLTVIGKSLTVKGYNYWAVPVIRLALIRLLASV